MTNFVQKSRYTLDDLRQIMVILRAPDGCPWDKVQTHTSIRKNLIEETYEVADAIDQDDPVLMCEELGDLLLQVVFHCQIEEEQGHFTLDDAADGICKKMIYRHPYIFGEGKVSSAEEGAKLWEELKNKAKGRTTATADVESVPHCLPALMRAAKVQKRAGRYGLQAPDVSAALAEAEARLAALREAVDRGEDVRTQAGDLLFSAANAVRMAGQDAEEVLTGSTERFMEQVYRCEALAAGRELTGLDEAERAALWQEAGQALQSTGD